jgi:transcriptional regulator with XRE-family HTH domain
MGESRDNLGNAFGVLLGRRLKAAGLNQSSASYRAGFDHSYFSRLISGSRMPTRDAVDKIAEALAWTEAEHRTALMAAGFLPGEMLGLIDSDILAFADALSRAESHDQVWAETVRENTRALTYTANRLADMYERLQDAG